MDWTHHIGEVENPVIHSAFGYAAQLVVADPASGAIERVVAAHDVGRAVNPTLCEGQVEGSVHMGLGYALTEEFPADEMGVPTKATLRSLGILRAKDVPPIEVILVEVPQPLSPYGIKGVGEIGLVPTAGAVAAALHEVDGQWRTTLPMKPAKGRPCGRRRRLTQAHHRHGRAPASFRGSFSCVAVPPDPAALAARGGVQVGLPAVQPRGAVGHETVDGHQDVLGAQVSLGDHLVDAPPGPPPVVPVR